jgi:RNA polymerase sigma factor for flagellar operon FliA
MPKKDKKIEHVWKEYLKSRREALRDHLITHYLHLVKIVVSRLASTFPKHVREDDMYSTGVIGLIKAVEKYDPERKAKFETYAQLLIKGSIIDEMRALDWVPRSVHQKANEIEKATRELQLQLGREPSDEEIAGKMGVSLERYDALVLRVRPAIILSLDKETDEDQAGVHISERIADDRAKTGSEVADQKEFSEFLEEAVFNLPEQEKTVLVLYYYENLMLKEIGKIMGVTESRVSQIHTKALIRLRARLRPYIKEFSHLL